MNEAFPFGLPGATALYATLYALTLLLHAILNGYVLAGSGWVALHALAGRRPSARVAGLLRDWLPFALGSAITLGVAPLLFLQILYREAFYSANLLLFWRWMAIVPALIAGFYGLYLAKTERLHKARRSVRAALGIATWGCFAFVAFSFSDQHSLALARGSWVGVYRDGPLGWREPAVLARVAIWVCGSLPAMAAVMGFQLRAAHEREGVAAAERPAEVRRLALAALVGFAGAGGAAFLYRSLLGEEGAEAFTGPVGRPWLFVGAGGALVACLGWLGAMRRTGLTRLTLALAGGGTVIAMTGAIALREALRLSALDLDALAALHARAAQASGFGLFVVFLVVNAGVLVACVSLVRRSLRAGGGAGTGS